MIPDSAARSLGALCIVVSAAGFGAMPIFAKIAYAQGVDLTGMLCLRFVLSGTVLAAYMVWRRIPWPGGSSLLALMAMGGLGYVGQSYCYFAALQYATAGLTALLLYLYPVIVTVLSAFLARQRLTSFRLLTVVTALCGIGLAVGGTLDGTMMGVILGVSAALIYSVYILVGEKVTPSVGAVPSATVIMLSAALVYGTIASVRGAEFPATSSAWAAIAGISFLSTLASMITFFVGMQRLGATDAATLSTLEPVVTVSLASLFLGEHVGRWQVTGGLMVLLSAAALVRFPDWHRSPE